MPHKIGKVNTLYMLISHFISILCQRSMNFYYRCLQRSLDKCTNFNHLKRIHALFVTLGILPNFQSLACKLLEAYKNFGKLRDAQKIFNHIQNPDIVSWTSLLNLYLHFNLPAESLSVFSLFIHRGLRPDSFLVVGALSSCGRGKDLIRGKAIHGIILRNHLYENSIVGNALIDMYCRNGQIEVAILVFERKRLKDIFSWTTLFNGYILSNDLLSARKLFDEMPERNSVSWTAMINGYVKGGDPVQALELFQKMELHLGHSAATMVAVLSACADTGALNFGRSIHGNVIKKGLELNVKVKNALMDMYSKSGRLNLAIRMFDEILDKDVFSWTIMISGYAYHGKGQDALEVYSQMLLAESKVTPNEVTLLSLLTACSHSGLVHEGKMLFNRMIHYHGLKPNIQHYGCLVDLLGRAGFLEEAKEMFELMTPIIEPDAVIWRSFLKACLVHGNLKLAVMAGRKVVEVEGPSDDGVYMLLWNAYYAANMWKEALEVRKMMRDGKVRRKPGCSWIEVNGIVHEFHADDDTLLFHFSSDQICLLLEELKEHSKTVQF